MSVEKSIFRKQKQMVHKMYHSKEGENLTNGERMEKIMPYSKLYTKEHKKSLSAKSKALRA